MSYEIKTEDGKTVKVKGREARGLDYFDGEVKDFSNKERSFLAVANAETEDRMGDIVMQDGWQLKNYRKNPVVMPFHIYSKLPVGRSLEEFTDEKKKVKRLIFRPQFAAYEEADLMYNLYRDKYLKGFSVGFIPLESEDIKPPDEKDKKKFFWRAPQRFIKSELLEVSVAPIPAHPDALSDIKSYVAKGSLYIPARYLEEEKGIEVDQRGDWIHATIAEEEEFEKLYESKIHIDDLDIDATLVFGFKKGNETEYFQCKFIIEESECETELFKEWVEESGKKCMDTVVEEQKQEDPPALRVYQKAKYTSGDDVVEFTGFSLLEEKDFEKEETKVIDIKEEPGEEGDEIEDEKDILGLPDGAELIEREEVEERPYPNEHACRLNDPGKYDRFARKNCYQKSDGKCIDYIFGVKGGKSEVQAMRYKKDVWTAGAAKSHCSSHNGTFEAAGKGQDEITLTEAHDHLAEVIEAFSDVVKGITDILQNLMLKLEAFEENIEPEPETESETIGEGAETTDKEIIEIIGEETEEDGIEVEVDKEGFLSMIKSSINSALGKLD